MGYVEKAMGDNERVVYTTHQHVVVLFERALTSIFAFVVFLVVSLAVLLSASDQVRFAVGVIALGSLVMPLYLIVSAWLRGQRGQDLVSYVWRAVVAGILILIVAVLLMLHPELRMTGWIAIVVAIAPLAEFSRILLDWMNERYIITNRRVMEVRGIVNKHVRDSALEKVNDVELDQSVMGRLLGYGTVQIITGSDIGINRFRRISNPVRFKREMLNAKERQSERVTDESGAGPMTPVADSEIPDLIAELDELRKKGILSEKEFAIKKKDLLSRL